MEKKENNAVMNSSNLNKIGFDDFLLSEYSNIAQAHFKSMETISTFFRYYILILSFPISAFGVFFQISIEKHEILKYILKYKVPISIVLFSVALIGFGMFIYILNLRFDALLYARTVNGIRKHFYKKSTSELSYKLRIRVLPQSTQLPNYFEPGFFFPIILVFGLINFIYIYLPLFLFFRETFRSIICLVFFSVAVLLIVFFLHYFTYIVYSRYREHSYLRSNIIGVDIDGVLNKHRDHFCQLLREKEGKNVEPSEITTIPVHENSKLNITREEERVVFNDPRYWIDMPAINEAKDVIKKLRNIFHLRIFIFTYRAWPDDPNEEKLHDYIGNFIDEIPYFNLNIFLLRILLNIPLTRKLCVRLKEIPLSIITREWLKRNDIKYDNFVLEKGNDNSSDPSGRVRNRFYYSREKQIRFFVEDDLEKAIKLSYVCDVVFLMSHPYNEPSNDLDKETNIERTKLPDNIVRVINWAELYKYIRKIL
jgi:uncharacterized HAD superfamily protein